MGTSSVDEARLGQLMARAQAGDRDAYRTLLETLAPLLRGLVAARRRGAASDEVEDLVQEILLSVHVSMASYDPARPFLPWLFAILRNRLADGARRYARKKAREVQVDDMDVTFAAAAPKSLAEGLEDAGALQQALQRLPPGQRQAIELLKLREMSLKEASRHTGTSEGALKVATHRAMASLRRVLAGR